MKTKAKLFHKNDFLNWFYGWQLKKILKKF